MSFAIVWPEDRTVSDRQIVEWYTEALALNRLPSRHVLARTPKAMAEALDDIGAIRLQPQD